MFHIFKIVEIFTREILDMLLLFSINLISIDVWSVFLKANYANVYRWKLLLATIKVQEYLRHDMSVNIIRNFACSHFMKYTKTACVMFGINAATYLQVTTQDQTNLMESLLSSDLLTFLLV